MHARRVPRTTDALALAEEMETPGKGQIRGFMDIAGNSVLSVPGGAPLTRARS